MSTRILLLGDVCGEPGRWAVSSFLPILRPELNPDFVIVNAENAAGGYGITHRLAEELFSAGADCLTTGDHAFDRKESWDFLSTEPRVLRPLNLPSGAPGRGWGIYHLPGRSTPIVVINLIGRVFMKPADCPFLRVKQVLSEIAPHHPITIVDFHAEATAEKQGMGYFLDGLVSAVIGTHTHIQTADEHILPQGTAFIADVGMCGAFDSILGMEKASALRRLVELVPVRLQPATADIRINGVIIEVDEESGRAQKITRLNRTLNPPT
ncbi:MAG: TIGR00282 family metallophosphoesterase [bacterium]